MAEIRDKEIRFAGLSISNYATASVTAQGYSANGYILSGGFAPTRIFNPDTAGPAEFRAVIATLIRDIYGPTG